MVCRVARLLPVFLLLALAAAAQDAANGEKLFKANCSSCHKVDRKLTGPALQGVTGRRTEDWIIKWVHNPQAVLASGDEYAVKLYNEYNQTQMTAFPQLADKEIKDILGYISAYKAPVTASAGNNGQPGAATANPLVNFTLLALTGVLALVCLALIVVIVLLSNALRAKREQAPYTWQDVVTTTGRVARNAYVLGIVGLLAVSLATAWTVKEARGVGLHQGYQPIQPVAFQHKVHAGQYGISCNYCHIGVEKGKSATIPSTNICMNCHNAINGEGKLVEGVDYAAEIKKVTTAYEENKPIEWVRIHNLPDFVYFNHAQHVKVAGLECTQCHGPIQEMNVVYQFSDLSMGWCINCHRETKVDVTKNDYYLQVHKAYQGKGSEVEITAATLGATECARCHY